MQNTGGSRPQGRHNEDGWHALSTAMHPLELKAMLQKLKLASLKDCVRSLLYLKVTGSGQAEEGPAP